MAVARLAKIGRKNNWSRGCENVIGAWDVRKQPYRGPKTINRRLGRENTSLGALGSHTFSHRINTTGVKITPILKKIHDTYIAK